MGHSNPAKSNINQSGKKEVISDEELLRQCRMSVEQKLYPSPDMTRVVLNEYDKLVVAKEKAQVTIDELKAEISILLQQLDVAKNGVKT